MEIYNLMFWIMAVVVCGALIVIGFLGNNKMRYQSDFQAMERSRNLENGVLRNERNY